MLRTMQRKEIKNLKIEKRESDYKKYYVYQKMKFDYIVDNTPYEK